MKRYATTKRKLDKSGVEVYRSTYFPQISVSDEIDGLIVNLPEKQV